ncbi:hypothetical protein, partial [Pseudomonas aeruginosa]
AAQVDLSEGTARYIEMAACLFLDRLPAVSGGWAGSL